MGGGSHGRMVTEIVILLSPPLSPSINGTPKEKVLPHCEELGEARVVSPISTQTDSIIVINKRIP